jgi:hypothetical protein
MHTRVIIALRVALLTPSMLTQNKSSQGRHGHANCCFIQVDVKGALAHDANAKNLVNRNNPAPFLARFAGPFLGPWNDSKNDNLYQKSIWEIRELRKGPKTGTRVNTEK